MLKEFIEQEYGCITDTEMDFALEGLTLEIKLRRISKGKKTALPYVMDKITSYIDYYRRRFTVTQTKSSNARTDVYATQKT
jgi:hypothetical protein